MTRGKKRIVVVIILSLVLGLVGYKYLPKEVADGIDQVIIDMGKAQGLYGKD